MTNLSVIVYNTVINQVNMTEAEFQMIVEMIADMADIHANSPTNTFLDKNELLVCNQFLGAIYKLAVNCIKVVPVILYLLYAILFDVQFPF